MNEYIQSCGAEKKPGLDVLLDYLQASPLRTAVCTATDFERTEMYLRRVGVFDKFDEFICGNMVERGKPAPDIYEYSCRRLGLEPCECATLEDSPNGVMSAYRAGCKVVMVPDQTQPDEKLKKCLYACVPTLADISHLI